MRSLSAAFLAAIALAAPGCCGRIDRADSVRSLDFTTRTIAARTRADADATARRVTGLPGSLGREWDSATRNLQGTGCLYTTGATR